MRFYLGVHKFVPNAALTAEMAWLKPLYSRYLCIIRFWNRLLKMDENRITKRVFIEDYNKCHKNWSHNVKMILSKLDIEHCYINKEICDLENVKTKLFDIMEKDIKEEIEVKPKLRTFKLFKMSPAVEPYLTCTLERHKRSLFAQFRCGILPLKIETGRFSRMPVEERLCEFCDLKKVEDEFHFLCECKLYADVRKTYFDTVKLRNPSFTNLTLKDKFVFLVKNNWRETINFIVTAWNTRKAKLYCS